MGSQNNALLGDVNEISFGYHVLGGTWEGFVNSEEIKHVFESRKDFLGEEIVEEQVGRAVEMARKTLEWANRNGFPGPPSKVWWTARSGTLARAVGFEVDSRRNPTDILLEFRGGRFLGVSAKSTKSSGDISFKNPGVGSLSRIIGVDLSAYVLAKEEEAITRFELPRARRDRKHFIRSEPSVQAETREIGRGILKQLRNVLLEVYDSKFSNNNLKEHLINVWLDAQGIEPRYIKVTGRGKAGKYSASVFDPVNNEKISVLSDETTQVSVIPVGNDSIGIQAGPLRVMKIRFKYESEKLASSVKLSGDPW